MSSFLLDPDFLDNPDVRAAAEWIAAHPDEIKDPPVPFIRNKFGLTIRGTIEAMRWGHYLRWHGK